MEAIELAEKIWDEAYHNALNFKNAFGISRTLVTDWEFYIEELISEKVKDAEDDVRIQNDNFLKAVGAIEKLKEENKKQKHEIERHIFRYRTDRHTHEEIIKDLQGQVAILTRASNC